ncbi:MAG: DUF5668 domain-containing protein [Pseudomonadota bacterium]
MKTESSCQSQRNAPAQVIIGLIVITVGMVALLTNMNVIDFPGIALYWPVLVIFGGLAKLLDSDNNQERIAFGGVILVGLALQLNRLGYDAFNLRTLWPLALVLVGGAVIHQSLSGRRDKPGLKNPGLTTTDATLDVTVLLAGMERSVTSKDFDGGEVSAIMGGCELDLRDASMQGDAVINVFVVMGGITLRIPPDWTVELNGTPIMGSLDEKTIAPKDTSKRLIIRGYVILGGVEVRN